MQKLQGVCKKSELNREIFTITGSWCSIYCELWCGAAGTDGCFRRCGSVLVEPESTSTPSTPSCSTSSQSTASATATLITAHRGWWPVKRTHRTLVVKSTGTRTRRCPAASSPLSRCLSRNSSWPTTTSTKTATCVPSLRFSSLHARLMTLLSAHSTTMIA